MYNSHLCYLPSKTERSSSQKIAQLYKIIFQDKVIKSIYVMLKMLQIFFIPDNQSQDYKMVLCWLDIRHPILQDLQTLQVLQEATHAAVEISSNGNS